jgi:hypothetical protein
MAATEAEIFKDEKTHPIVLLKSYLAMFGPEALEWEPAVIKQSVEDRTQANISRVALFKLLSAIAVANHDRFWDSWQTFHAVCQGLNGKIPSTSQVDDHSVGEMMVAVDIAKQIRRELGPATNLPDYAEEVQRYIAAQLLDSGIWYVPEPLDFVNELISGVTQICDVCGNEESPKRDGLCSHCTDRYNADSLMKLEPCPDLKKKYDGSKVRTVQKYPTAGVQKALLIALQKGPQSLKETQDGICAAKLYDAVEYLHQQRGLMGQDKTAGISSVEPLKTPSPGEGQQSPQNEPKKNTGVKKYITPGVMAGAGLVGAALLRKPGQAGKFLQTAKEVVTKPVTSVGRAMRAGSNYVGPGADDFARQAAQSKRVEMMSESLRQTQEQLAAARKSGDPLKARVDQFKVLEGKGQGGTVTDRLRREGVLSAGRQKYEGVEVSEDLAGRLDDVLKQMDEAAAQGKNIEYDKLRGIYDDLGAAARQQAGAGTATMGRGGLYYGPGERVMEVGAPVLTGGFAAAESEDPETGRKRGVAERLARGLGAASVTAGTGHLFAGRNLGLSKANLLTGTGRSGFSAKGLVPTVGGIMVAPAAETAVGDLAGAGGKLVDSAFGQKGDSE